MKIKIESVGLLYNAAAHFAANERYPEGLVAEMNKKGIESYEAVLWAFTEMAKQYELRRRFMGEKPKKILTEADWKNLLGVQQLRTATARVMDALIAGLGEEEHDEEREIDEVLAELEKKTGSTS